MLSLSEAIKHAEEVAGKYEEDAREGELQLDGTDVNRCRKCAEEHQQLADWLKELKWWRSCQHACETCKYCTKSISDEPCASCMELHVKNDKWECGYEGGETE